MPILPELPRKMYHSPFFGAAILVRAGKNRAHSTRSGTMDALLELIGVVISLVARVLVIIVATPVILLWPRQDKRLGYVQTVWRRCKRVLGLALA